MAGSPGIEPGNAGIKICNQPMSYISGQLQDQFNITKRRAAMIARDQTNKATEAVSQARSADIGITHGFWMHRSGGKVPRKTHLELDGQRFKLSDGLYDEDVKREVKPGELINCHCTYKNDLSTITGNGIAQDSKRRGTTTIKFPSAQVEFTRQA